MDAQNPKRLFRSATSDTWPQFHLERRRRRAMYVGLTFFVVGLLFLLKNMFPTYWYWVRGDIIWPFVFIFVGAYFLSRPRY